MSSPHEIFKELNYINYYTVRYFADFLTKDWLYFNVIHLS